MEEDRACSIGQSSSQEYIEVKKKCILYFDFQWKNIYIIIYIIINFIGYFLCEINKFFIKYEPILLKFYQKEDVFVGLLGVLMVSILKAISFLIYYYQLKANTAESEMNISDDNKIETTSVDGSLMITVNLMKNSSPKKVQLMKIFKRKKALFLLIFCSFFDFIINFIKFFSISGNVDMSLAQCYFHDIKFTLFVSFVILQVLTSKHYFYSHQFLSMSFLTIGFIIYLFLKNYIKDNPIGFLFAIFVEIFLAGQILTENWFIQKNYTSIFLIIGLEGAIEIVITIITFFVFLSLDFIRFKFDFEIIQFFPNYLTIVFLCYSKFLILNKTDELRFLFAEISSVGSYFYFIYIIKIFIKYKNKFSSLLIPDLIFIISMLIYSEILILNFCGLEKNTKKNIEERALIESKMCIGLTNKSYE